MSTERKNAHGKDKIWIALAITVLMMMGTGWFYDQQIRQINERIERLKNEELN